MASHPGRRRADSPAEGAGQRRKRRCLDLNKHRGAFDDPIVVSDDLDELRELRAHTAYDDPEIKSREYDMGSSAENARERTKAWNSTVVKIMLRGNSSGYISKKLGRVDPRPEMSDTDRERLLEYCRGQTNQAYPDSDPAERDELPGSIQHVFSDEFSTEVDSVQDAASLLGLDLGNLTPERTLPISSQSSLRLRLDQLQNVAFMIKKGEGIMRGCINGNDCGTGKTIEALTAVYFMAQRRAWDPDAKHKPVIILSPHIAILSWLRDAERYFSGLLTMTDASALSKEEVVERVRASSTGDPEASRQIFLFTFSSLANRFLSKKPAASVAKKTLSNPRSKLTEEQAEAFRSSEKEILFEMDEEMGSGKFGVCIVDEAHEMKHPKSKKAQAHYLLCADINFLITATPISNRVSDLRGLLFSLYRSGDWQLKWPRKWRPKKIIKTFFADDFNVFDVPGVGSIVPDNASPAYRAALTEGQHLWRLNPALYRWLGHHQNFQGTFSGKVIGSIARLCLLHRSGDSEIVLPGPSSGNMRLSSLLGVPAASISTVEVTMSYTEQRRYDCFADWWFPRLYNADATNRPTAALLVSRNEIPRSGFNKTMDWRLKSLTAELNLAQITRFRGAFDFSLGNEMLDFDAIAKQNEDLGVSFYYKVTRQKTDPEESPAARGDMLRYMLKAFPEMHWLLSKLWEWRKRGEKVVIFCVHSLTQWFLERVCLLFGAFEFLSLSSESTQKTRTRVMADFSNPGSKFDFLITTFNVAGTSVGLQGDCSKMVIFELPENFPAILNAIGRIHRSGQANPQDITILTMSESYDDFLLTRAFGKYVVEICGKKAFVDFAKDVNINALGSAQYHELRRSRRVSLKQALAGELVRR